MTNSDIHRVGRFFDGIAAGSILPRHTLQQMANASLIVDEANEILQKAKAEARQQLDAELDTQKSQMIGRIQTAYMEEQLRAQQATMDSLDEVKAILASTVAKAVKMLLGDIPPEERVFKVTMEALRQVTDMHGAKIMCATDAVARFETIVGQLEQEFDTSIQIVCDPALEAGQAILTNSNGHFEIGEQAILRNAIGGWADMANEDMLA